MLPDLPKFTPITNLFIKETFSSFPSELLAAQLIFLAIITLFIVLFIADFIHFSKRQKNKNVVKQKLEKFSILISGFLLFAITLYFVFIYPPIDRFNKINNLSPKTILSNYNINKIEKVKNVKQAVTYDVYGNRESEESEFQFNIYLNKNKNVDGYIYNPLKDTVVIKVSKINKNSFNIILSDNKVATIKEKEAKEIFNTLKKISTKEREK